VRKDSIVTKQEKKKKKKKKNRKKKKKSTHITKVTATGTVVTAHR